MMSSQREKENASGGGNKPRYMMPTAGEKQRRQSMLVKPAVSTATLRKRPPTDKTPNNSRPASPVPLAQSSTRSQASPTQIRHSAPRDSASESVTRLKAEVVALTAKLAEKDEMLISSRAKIRALEDEVRMLRSGDDSSRQEWCPAADGEVEKKLQETVGTYCHETDERMKKLHALIDKLQTHLHPHHHQPEVGETAVVTSGGVAATASN